MAGLPVALRSQRPRDIPTVTAAKDTQHFHLNVPPGSNLNNYLLSSLSDMLFYTFLFGVNARHDMLVSTPRSIYGDLMFLN